MSHCLQAADAYLNLVKVKWSSSSQKDVLGWVFNLMGDSFILFGWGEPNNIADIFIYVRWDFDQTIMDQLAYRKVGKVVALLGLLLESDKQTVKKRNLSGSKSNWLSASCFCQWRRQWQAIPVLLPGKSHGRRSLVGCSPWGREESDTTERLHFHFSLSCIGEGNGNPLQCSCLENPRDGEAWWAAVYGVTQSRTRLKQLSSSSSSFCRIWETFDCSGYCLVWSISQLKFTETAQLDQYIHLSRSNPFKLEPSVCLFALKIVA